MAAYGENPMAAASLTPDEATRLESYLRVLVEEATEHASAMPTPPSPNTETRLNKPRRSPNPG